MIVGFIPETMWLYYTQKFSSTGKKLTAHAMYDVISADATEVNWEELSRKIGLPGKTCLNEMLKKWLEKTGIKGSKKPWKVWRKLSSAIERMDKYGPKVSQKLRELSGVGEFRLKHTFLCLHLPIGWLMHVCVC